MITQRPKGESSEHHCWFCIDIQLLQIASTNSSLLLIICIRLQWAENIHMISVHRMWRNCWATGPTTISNRSSEIVYNVHQALFATWKWMPYSEHTKDVSIVWSGIVPVNYWLRARMTCRSVCGIHFANRWSWTFSHRTMAIYFRWNLCHAAAMGCWRLARVMANCSCTISNRRMWCQYGNVIVIIRGLSV